MTPDVAIFASSFHPHLGGVEELVRQLAHHQQANGARPLVTAMRWPRDLPTREEFEGLPVCRFVYRLPEPKVRWLAAYAAESQRIQRAVNRAVADHEAEVVHIQCVSGNALYAYRAAKRLGLPLVVSLQGELAMDANNVYRTSKVLPRLLRRLLRDAELVTACSAQTLREAESFASLTLGDRGRVIHNGVSLDEIDSAVAECRSADYIFAIGRHVPQKGFDVLLHAYARLREEHADPPDLVIAGDGPDRPVLEELARALRVHDHVAFVGRTDRTRTASLFKGCKLFVLPSRHEPQGIVNLEAMAAGKAVVATRAGGVPEIVIHGETGLLVAPDDPAALATGVAQVLDGGELDRMGSAGFERAKAFDWGSVAARYDDAYAFACAARAGGR